MILALVGVAVFAFVIGYFAGFVITWRWWSWRIKKVQDHLDEIEGMLKGSINTSEEVNKLKERKDARS